MAKDSEEDNPPKKKLKKKGRAAAAAPKVRKTKNAKKKRTKKAAKKATPPRLGKKNPAGPLPQQIDLYAQHDFMGAEGAPTVNAVDDCVKDWLRTWLPDTVGNKPLSAPFPDSVLPVEIDGGLTQLRAELTGIAPNFEGANYINGDKMVQLLGPHGSIGLFVHLVYYYALKACGLRA